MNIIDIPHVIKMSPREIEVLDLISQGYTDKEIGQQLFLSPDTIKSHRKKVIRKLNCRNAVDMVRKAIELQILQLSYSKN